MNAIAKEVEKDAHWTMMFADGVVIKNEIRGRERIEREERG